MAWIDRLGMRKGQEWWRVQWTVLEPGGHFVFPAGLAGVTGSASSSNVQKFRSSSASETPSTVKQQNVANTNTPSR